MKTKHALSMYLLFGVAILIHLLAGCDFKLEQGPNAVEQGRSKVITSAVYLRNFIFKIVYGSDDLSSPLQSLVPFSMISWGYELDKDKWITFQAPVASDRIKIVTNANLVGGINYDPGAKWRYSFDWQVLEKGTNRIVKSGQYNYETGLTRFSTEDIEKPYTAAFYLDSSVIPADGRIFIINTKELSLAGKPIILRFRLASTDPGVSSVLLRTYNLEPPSERRLDFLWMRITKRQQDILSQGNVYPSELLTEIERQNLLRQLWAPLSPEGIEGRDFIAKKIYIIRDIEGAPVEDPIIPEGILVNASLRGTLPIPEDGRNAKFDFSHVGPSDVGEDSSIRINWYGLDITERKSFTIPWNGVSLTWEGFFKGGIVEFLSETPLVVKPSWISPKGPQPAFPEQLYVRTYTIENDKSVVFKVAHSNRAKTPLRIDFRALFDEALARNHAVKYALLGLKGETVKEGKLDFPSIPSSYDLGFIGDYQAIVSDPQSFYFRLPPESPYIKLSSERPLITTAYTRPADLVKETNVPQDYFQESVLLNVREPDWFLVRPLNYESLIKDQRSVLTKIQLRPPEDDPDIMAGRFWWEQFRPIGAWSGQYLLTPQDKTLPYRREESLVSGFSSVPVGSDIRINLRSDCDLRVVTPTIIFLRKDDESPFRFLVSLDGSPFVNAQLIGRRGMFRLPPIYAGIHHLRIDSTEKDISFLMNHLASSEIDNQVRFANLFSDGKMEVEYFKRSTEDEILSLTLYAPYGQKSHSTIRVRLCAPSDETEGPLDGITILDRRFKVIPSSDGPCPIINNPEGDLEAGQKMFFPVHGDIPPGSYHIRVELEDGAANNLELNRVLPGTFEQREFREEVILDDANRDL
ncbi:MAG: hypothetical protein NTW27_07415 [Deltaproteobacteria bacterium]|nr:hypothetical protein [Deltaproteobacteria bacterium]